MERSTPITSRLSPPSIAAFVTFAICVRPDVSGCVYRTTRSNNVGHTPYPSLALSRKQRQRGTCAPLANLHTSRIKLRAEEQRMVTIKSFDGGEFQAHIALPESGYG